MSILWAFTVLVIGVILLWKGADWLVAGSVALAERFGVSPLIIGLTIVAMGTSAPEMAASIAAVFMPKGGDIALGNICGSNIANLALVGGAITLIRPLEIKKQVLLREFPLMIGVALGLWIILRDATVTRAEALVLLASFAVLCLATVLAAIKKPPPQEFQPDDSRQAQKSKATSSVARLLFLIVLGLSGLTVGAKLALKGSVTIGYWLGIPEAAIGIAIIAVGTSLPELVTCIVAMTKGHHDISIGNLVGSNIFNTLLVTGSAGIANPFKVSARFSGGVDYWAMVCISIFFWILAILGRGKIGRITGSVLMITYVGYITYTSTCVQ